MSDCTHPVPRLDAIDDLMGSALQVGGAKEVLKGLPDLERLLRK